MWLYGLTIFAGSALLFLIQPMIGKALLPWFGGTPAVWTTCLLLFQLLLLLGYAYTHLLIARFSPKAQARTHLGLLLAAIALLLAQTLSWGGPLVPGSQLAPTGSQQPLLRLVWLLSISVGLPYFALSASSPLLQAWYARAAPGRSPYRLYALSNAGSLLGLLSYPFLVEPALDLGSQAWIWSGGFALIYTLGCTACALRASSTPVPSLAPPVADPVGNAPAQQAGPPTLARMTWWLFLPACGTALLMAVTNQLCEEVAAVPFLWVLPLGLYLLSFILCFDHERWADRRFFMPALVLTSLLAALALHRVGDLSIPTQVALFSLWLFAGCMVCHGELVRLKPHPRYLTSFYLMVAAGGAMGGVLVAIVAPAIFDGTWEFHLSLLACSLLAAASLARDSTSWLGSGRFRPWKLVGVGLWLLSLAAILGTHWWDYHASARALSRNFYGVLRVVEVSPEDQKHHYFRLMHGRIVHGYQFTEGNRRKVPTAYYGSDSGVGLAFATHPRNSRDEPLRVGAVGLGIGTIAAYGRAGDVFRFYEINPEVTLMAQGQGGFFRYLSDSPASIEVVDGDARLELEHELARGEPGRFDLLVVDAFSSGTIPMHLLTEEAFRIYLAHLADPDSLIALHISNRDLDLRPVVWAAANRLGLSAACVESQSDGDLVQSALWMLLARNPERLAHPAIVQAAMPQDEVKPVPVLWTDRTGSLFGLLR